MTFSIAAFIESNCSNFDESIKCANNKNEFKRVFEVLHNVELRAEISKGFEELKAKVDSVNLKSISDSNKYREEGNRLFRADKKGNALAASRYYTNAMFAAPKDSSALALAHANRAAALVECGYYFDAYTDCQLALNLGYPKEKRVKILMRQAYCSVKLKNYFQLEDTLEQMRDMQLKEPYLKQRQDYEEHLKILAELPSNWKQDDPHDYKVQNILFHPKKGRYMTAWKNYKKNDVIVSEKAFTLVPVNNARICSNCANEQFIPYPCYTCYKVVYCSQYCKLADEKIHQYECFGYKCHLYQSLGVTHLAMRTVICGLPDILSELINCTSTYDIWKKIETIGKSRKKGYPQILSLYNNLHVISPKALRILVFGSIMAANYLLSCTKFSDLYIESPCSSFDWLIIISALILRHAIQMLGNAQSSVSVVYRDKPYDFLALADIWKEPKHLKKGLLHGFREIGVNFAGIYPYLSLCNHACEPSLQLNFDGNRLIAKARNGLKKGEEIFNTYVLDCRNMCTKDRKEDLRSSYHFECDCKHCAPGSNDEEYLQFHKYRCRDPNCKKLFSPLSTDNKRWWLQIAENPEPSIKCPSCKTAIDVDWFIQFDKLFKVDNFQSTELIEVLKLFKYSEQISYGSELRQYMAHKIVTSFFEMWKNGGVIEEKFFKEVANVLKYWLDQVEKQNDVETVLYATISTFALDFMAEGKCFNFDKKKIRRAIDMLSTELKIIFENYIKDYIGDKFD